MKKRKIEDECFEKLIYKIAQNEHTLKMKNSIQHGTTTTYSHSLSVAKISYRINRKLHIGCDEKTLVTAAFLHDFFLYDWHNEKECPKKHGFVHPKIASDNAKMYFNINDKEQKIIESHMWPLTFRKPPSSREAVVLCFADKYCAVKEFFQK